MKHRKYLESLLQVMLKNSIALGMYSVGMNNRTINDGKHFNKNHTNTNFPADEAGDFSFAAVAPTLPALRRPFPPCAYPSRRPFPGPIYLECSATARSGDGLIFLLSETLSLLGNAQQLLRLGTASFSYCLHSRQKIPSPGFP